MYRGHAYSIWPSISDRAERANVTLLSTAIRTIGRTSGRFVDLFDDHGALIEARTEDDPSARPGPAP
jgi:hypothetical protein